MNKMKEFKKWQHEVSKIGEEQLKIDDNLEPLQEKVAQIMESFLELQREITFQKQMIDGFQCFATKQTSVRTKDASFD